MKLTRLFAVALLTLGSWMSAPSHALTPEYFQLLNETQGFLKALAPTITRPPICTPAMVSEGQGAVERGIRNMAYKIIVIEPLESAAKLALTAAGLPGAAMTTYTMSRCAMDASDANSFVHCALGEAMSYRGGEILKNLGVKNREQAIANFAWDKAYSTMLGAINQYQAAPEVFEYTESHGCQNKVQADWKKRRQPGAEGGQIVLVATSTKCACTRPNQIDHGSMRMVVPVRLVRTGNDQPGWSAGEPREIPITVACCTSPNAEQGVGVIPGGGVTYPRDQSVPIGGAGAAARTRTATTGGLGGGSGSSGTSGSTGSSGSGNAIAIPGGAPPRPGQPGGAPLAIGGAGSGTTGTTGTPATGGQRWSVNNPCPACQPIADALKASLAEEARLAPLLKKAQDDLRATILELDALKPKIAALQSQLNAMAGTGGESVDRDTGVRTESYVQPDGSVRIRTFDRNGKMTSETTRPYEAAQKARAELAAANARLAVLNAQEPAQARAAAQLDDAVRTAQGETERLRGALAACVEEKCKGTVAPGPVGRVGTDPNPPATGAWYNPDRPPGDGIVTVPGGSTTSTKGKDPQKKPIDKEPAKKEGNESKKKPVDKEPAKKGGDKPTPLNTPAADGLTVVNAVCVPCRGLAHELRAYEDFLVAARVEFERRTAAVRALTDAALRGGLTETQRAQATVDAQAAEALQARIAEIEAAIVRSRANLQQCIREKCTAAEPRREIEVGGGVPAGGRPPVRVGQVPANLPDSEYCDCAAYLASADHEIDQARKEYMKERDLESQLVISRAAIQVLYQQLAASKVPANEVFKNPEVKQATDRIKQMSDDAEAAGASARMHQGEATRLRGLHEECSKRCQTGSGAGGGGGVGAVPGGSPPMAAGPSATAGTQCDCETPRKKLLEARQKAQELEEKAKAARERSDRAFADFLSVYAAVREADPSLSRQQAMASPLAREASQKSEQAKSDVANAQAAVADQQAVIRDAQRAYDECLKRCREGGGGGGGGGGGVGVVPGVGSVAPAPVSAGQPCDCASRFLAPAEQADRDAERYGAEAATENAAMEKLQSQIAALAVELAEASGGMRVDHTRIGQYPPIVRLLAEKSEHQERREHARRMRDMTEDSARRYRAEYLECMKRCAAPPEPKVIIGINTGGNNPWNPRDPLGPRTPTGGGGPPVQPGSPGVIQFASGSYSTSEGGGPVQLTLQRTGGRTGRVSASYETAHGTAGSADYFPASGELFWEDGDDAPKTLSIVILDDATVEQTEAFVVRILRIGGGATGGSIATANVTIADNDSPVVTNPGTLQLALSQYETSEGAGSVTITATRTGGSDGVVGVSYSTNPSTATAGQDFTPVNGTLQWASGDASPKTFSVPIINDTLVEQTETFFVALNNPTGGATLGAPSTVSVAIQDNDVDTGPCGAQGNAWQPNTGAPYSCAGSCIPNAQSPVITVNGNVVTISNFHAGGSATFVGCGSPLTSQSNTLTYFGNSNHTATISRITNFSWQASIMTNPPGGSCFFSCSR